jgi:hypothetical protein
MLAHHSSGANWSARLTAPDLCWASMLCAEDRIIAEIGDRRVLYAEVGWNRERAAANRQWLRGRSVEEACLDAEREKFRTIAARVLVEKICALEGCEPSEDDLVPFRSQILKDENMLRALVTEGRKVPEAVRRVYLGEPIEKVYDEVIKPMNKPLDAFRQEVAMYRSLEVVERYLARDWVGNARQHYEQQARQRAMRAAVRKRIEAVATTKNQTLPNAAEDYLRSMIERLGARVLDTQFELPSGKEIFL